MTFLVFGSPIPKLPDVIDNIMIIDRNGRCTHLIPVVRSWDLYIPSIIIRLHETVNRVVFRWDVIMESLPYNIVAAACGTIDEWAKSYGVDVITDNGTRISRRN